MAFCLINLVRYTYELANEVLQRIHDALQMSHLVPGLKLEGTSYQWIIKLPLIAPMKQNATNVA